MSRPSVSTCQALSASSAQEVSSRRDTELIEASASPRKPRVATRSRSSRSVILLVAWRDRASGRSSWAMPRPSSRTRNSFTPPCSTSISTRVAPASRLFSSSSLMTEAGRSTTSPAAIWLASRGVNKCIRDIFNPMTASGVIFHQHAGGRYLEYLPHSNLIVAQPIGLAQADIVPGGNQRQGITPAHRVLAIHLGQLAVALERGQSGARRRVAVEVAADPAEHGPRQSLLVTAGYQFLRFTRVGDESGLDQD